MEWCGAISNYLTNRQEKRGGLDSLARLDGYDVTDVGEISTYLLILP